MNMSIEERKPFEEKAQEVGEAADTLSDEKKVGNYGRSDCDAG